MLNAGRFVDRAQGIRTFWRLVKFLLEKQERDQPFLIEEQDDVLQRKTWYVDTPSSAMYQKNFVLHLREEPDSNKPFKVTLKYRSSDRYLSAFQDTCAEDGEYKFEEDIIPPFASKYANSTSFRKKNSAPKLETMADAVELFPGLKAVEVPGETELRRVNAFEAQEFVHWVGKLHFADEPVVKCAMSFWYLVGEANELPLVAEFSFDYDQPDLEDLECGQANPNAGILEQFPAALVDKTGQFFRALQKQGEWMNFSATTKTAYAYEAF
jgi:hypothetical protein